MGNDNSALREKTARLDEKSKFLVEAVNQDKEFRRYLSTLQQERTEERNAERTAREEKEKVFQTILEAERKQLKAERREKEQQNREIFNKQLEEQQKKEERNREELTKQLEEQQNREERNREELTKQPEEQQYREERNREELTKQLEEQQYREERNREELTKQLEEQQYREERNREELTKQLEEQKAREEQLAQQRANEKLEEDLRKEIERKRDRVNKLKPGSTLKFSKLKFPNILNIGFFGTTGVGKTSLMNSLVFAINGELEETQMEQASPEDFQGGHTVRRLRIQVTEHIALIDNRGVGIEDLISDKSDMELIRQLEGRGSFTDEVDWRRGKLSKKKGEKKDRIYCTVLVFDARKAQSYFKVVTKYVSILKEWLGRFPISVITNVDRATPDELEELCLVLRSAGISDYYNVENMTKESMILKEEYQLSLLNMMERCFKDGDRIFELRQGRK